LADQAGWKNSTTCNPIPMRCTTWLPRRSSPASSSACARPTRNIFARPGTWDFSPSKRSIPAPLPLGSVRSNWDTIRPATISDAIFAAAELATSRREGSLPAILKLLESPDSGVRYWGTIGVLTQGAEAVTSGREQLVKALGDEAPLVRIGAGRSVGPVRRGGCGGAGLGGFGPGDRSGGDTFAALAAWNALDELDERARPVLATLEATPAVPVNPPNQRVAKYAQSAKTKLLADLGVRVPKKDR